MHFGLYETEQILTKFQLFQMILVKLNENGDLDFAADCDGLFFHNMAVDERSGIIVPLSLSTELDFFKISDEDRYLQHFNRHFPY